MNIIAPPLGLVTAVAGFVAALLARLLTERRVSLGASALTGLLVGLTVALWERSLWGRRAVPRRMLTYAPRGRRSRRPSAPPPSATPVLADLLRVIPVAQMTTHEGTALTIMSIEVYRDGFLVHSRMSADRTQPLGIVLSPEFGFTGRDEHGGSYRGWPRGGSGNDREWRFDHVFGPALDPDARRLTLEITEIVWERLGPEAWDIARAQPGPWRYEIALD